MKKTDRRYQESSKKRLLNNIEKKFNTTMIGSLAVFEDCFGHLWGQDKRFNELTELEKEWREVWNEARSKVLDNGNSNLRAAQNEIAQYTLSWDRYITEMPFKGRN